MNRFADPGFDQRLADWLEDDPDNAPPIVLGTVLAAFPSIPQRGAWRTRWRFATMLIPARLAATAAVVLLVAGGGIYLLGGRGATVGGQPTLSPTQSPSPAASVSTVPVDLPQVGSALQPGTYRLPATFPARLVFTTNIVPKGEGLGWKVARTEPTDVSIFTHSEPAAYAAYIDFETPKKVYADPCATGSSVEVPNVGPTVDDFIAALAKMNGFTMGPVTSTTFLGLPAKAVDLTNSYAFLQCKDNLTNEYLPTWDTGRTKEGARQHLVLFDWNGTRLLVHVLYTEVPPTTAVDRAVTDLLGSIRSE